MPKAYPPEFRRMVLDLVAAGRPAARVAHDLEISAQCICTWRRQQLVDSGQVPGMTSSDHAELVAARRRIAELEAGLAPSSSPIPPPAAAAPAASALVLPDDCSLELGSTASSWITELTLATLLAKAAP